eukprot:gene8514-10916_t
MGRALSGLIQLSMNKTLLSGIQSRFLWERDVDHLNEPTRTVDFTSNGVFGRITQYRLTLNINRQTGSGEV